MTVPWPGRPGFRCLGLSLAMAAPLLVAFVVIRRRSDPVHPGIAGAALGITAGVAAGTLVDLWCPIAYLPHVLLGHILPLVARGAVRCVGRATSPPAVAIARGPYRRVDGSRLGTRRREERTHRVPGPPRGLVGWKRVQRVRQHLDAERRARPDRIQQPDPTDQFGNPVTRQPACVHGGREVVGRCLAPHVRDLNGLDGVPPAARRRTSPACGS